MESLLFVVACGAGAGLRAAARRRSSAVSLDPDIESHYRVGLERERLREGGTVEFVRTRELLVRFLPAPPAVIVDVGGGALALCVHVQTESAQCR